MATAARTDPFDALHELLTTTAGRAMARAIMEELRVQRDEWKAPRGSVKLAIEIARSRQANGAGGPGVFRIDNRIAPALARLVLQARPALRGWLECRRMEGEDEALAAAYNDPTPELAADPRLPWLDPARPLRPIR